MKQKLFIILLAAATLSTHALHAEIIQVEDLYYDLIKEEVGYDYENDKAIYDYYAVVTCKSYNNSTYNSGWGISDANIPESVTFNQILYPVRHIAERAFSDCTHLRSVTIPSSVQSIGDNAFYGCSQLTSITINASWLAAYLNQCKTIFGDQVTEYIYGDDITEIGKRALYNYDNVTTVIVGKNVEYIGEEAFLSCDNLATVTLGTKVTTISTGAFRNCAKLTSIIIPNSVTYLGASGFSSCSSLSSITLSDKIEFIGANLFYECTNLASIDIPNSVQTIGTGAFTGCSSLGSIVIPDNVTAINYEAFYNCSSLTTVTIGKGVKSVGLKAFAYCTNISRVNTTDIAAWAGIDFDSDTYNPSTPLFYAKELYYNDEKVTSIILPEGVERIGECAFYDCKCLESISIPNSVTTIGKEAFDNCANLKSIVIGSGVQSIGYDAFSSCTKLEVVRISDIKSWCGIVFSSIKSTPTYYSKNLYLNNEVITSIVIPDDVTNINNYAFYTCRDITSVKLGKNVTSVGKQAFYNCTNLASLEFGSSTGSIGEKAFYGCSNITSPLIIPNSVTNIGAEAFRYCKQIPSVTLGAGVQSIGDDAFFQSEGIESVYISDLAAWCAIKFASAGSPPCYYGKLYLNNELITDMVIPEGVTKINDYAFYLCQNITSVTIPNSVTSIGEYAFAGSGLKSAIIGNNVKVISKQAFETSGLAGDIVLPNSVTSIGASAFRTCKISKLTIGSGLSSIGAEALSGCLDSIIVSEDNPKYRSIDGVLFNKDTTLLVRCPRQREGQYVIPKEVTTIGSYSFANSALTSVCIPKRVTKINEQGFGYCKSLESIICKAVSCPSLGTGAFTNVQTSIPVLVPAASLNTYTTTSGWKNFKNYQPVVFEEDLDQYGYDTEHNIVLCIQPTDEATTCNNIYYVGSSNNWGKGNNNTGAYENCIKFNAIEGMDGWFAAEIPFAEGEKGMPIQSRADGIWTLEYQSGYSDAWLYIDGNEMQFATSDEHDADITFPSAGLYIYRLTYWKNHRSPCLVVGDACGSDLTWTYNPVDSTLAIIGTGDMTHYDNDNSKKHVPWYNYLHEIKSIDLSDAVTNIGNSAFYACPNLRSITLPKEITTIGSKAFKGCTGLNSITFPESVATISSYAFEGCTGLESLTCEATTVPNISSSNAFNQVDKTIPIFVPRESLEAYKATKIWKDFTNIRPIGGSIFYTVTFVDWDETVLKSELVEEGESATAPAEPTREGYTFTGWDKEFSNITTDLTVTAQYEKNTVELPYVALIGEMNNWDGGVNPLTPAGNKETASAKVNLDKNESGTYAFKLLVGSIGLSTRGNGDWYHINREVSSAKLNWVDANSDPLILEVDMAGEFTFTYNYADSTLTVVFPKNDELPAACPAPTMNAANVKSIYSDAYTAASVINNLNMDWWQGASMKEVTLGENDKALYYYGLSDVSVFGWEFSELNATGFQKLHISVYPLAASTLEVYPVIQPEDHFHKVTETLVANQWNEVVLDYTNMTFTPFQHLGWKAKDEMVAFYVDNVYFFVEDVGTSIDNTGAQKDVLQIFRDGQIYILRDGKTYTMQGLEVR